MQVQAELVRRRNVHTGPKGQKRIYSGNNCFSHMVICGECSELYRRVHWNNHGYKSIVWRCISRLEPSRAAMNCTSRTVKEELMQKVTTKAFNQILNDKDGFPPADAGEHCKSDNDRRHDDSGRYSGQA